MITKEQAEEFIDNSCPAIEHLFTALNLYNDVLERTQAIVEEIEQAKQSLSDLFMYRDQWSPNANHNYVQYMMRMEHLEKQKNDTRLVEKALINIGSTVESMSILAGTVLQIGKQSLSLRYSKKPDLPAARKIGKQETNIVDVIWEGRNHALHWDEDIPRERVRNTLESIGITIAVGRNNSLSILGALEWKTQNNVILDLKSLMDDDSSLNEG